MIIKVIYDEYAYTNNYDEQSCKPRAKASILAFFLFFLLFLHLFLFLLFFKPYQALPM
jgi:hypothetical protein